VRTRAALHGKRRAALQFRAELRAAEAKLGPGLPAAAGLATELAALLHAAGERAQAEYLLRHALLIQLAELGPGAQTSAEATDALAAMHAEIGWLGSAEALRAEAVATREAFATTAALAAAAAVAAAAASKRGYVRSGRSSASAALARATAAGSRPARACVRGRAWLWTQRHGYGLPSRAQRKHTRTTRTPRRKCSWVHSAAG